MTSTTDAVRYELADGFANLILDASGSMLAESIHCASSRKRQTGRVRTSSRSNSLTASKRKCLSPRPPGSISGVRQEKSRGRMWSEPNK